MAKVRVAVLIGGLSGEHDVSVLTGLEALEALDPAQFEGFPVYVGLDGQWWVGEALRERKNYLPDLALKKQLTRVCLAVGNSRGQDGGYVLRAVEKGLFGGAKEFAFDVLLPALHGGWGEDGVLQGVAAAEGIPCVGGGVGAMALTINKLWTLQIAAAVDVPVLPTLLVRRGETLTAAKATKDLGKFPLFVKPNQLGSSLGAQVVRDAEALESALAAVFRLDTAALVQPCVPHLVEYNVAVRRRPDGTVTTSAIERPVRPSDSQDASYSFKDKYLSQGVDSKLTGVAAGLVHATRALHPKELDAKREGQLRAWAAALFNALELAGAPRLDFLCNEQTGEIWFNEINPIPGSLGWFLWADAKPEQGGPLPYPQLLADMLSEARQRSRTQARLVDPVVTGGAIFRKRG